MSLFVCFSTKAVHLEPITVPTKETIILALRHFVARKGKPCKLFTDGGTNFVRANAELKKLGDFLRDNGTGLTEFGSQEEIDWKSISPSFPYFGG